MLQEARIMPQLRRPPMAEGLSFGRTRRIVFNRHCLWRLNPAGAFALLRRTKRSCGRVCRTAVHIQTYTPKRKTPADGEGLSFGRTRRITRNRLKPVSSLRASRHGRSVANAPRVAFGRTADLYHVKADWPHQDTHGRIETNE